MPRAFGLDIDDFSLKVALIEYRGGLHKKRSYFLKNYNAIEIPSGLVKDGEIKDAKKLRIYLETLLQQAVNGPINLKNVFASLPENRTFLKEIIVPNAANTDIASFLKQELEKQIPANVDDLYLDWQTVEMQTSGKTKLLVGATPKSLIDGYLAFFEESGITPLVLEPESLSIVRALLEDGSASLPDRTTVIIDFGGARTEIIFCENNNVRLSISSEISGSLLTKAIAEKEKINLEEAEKLKLQCGLDPSKCETSIKPILLNHLKKLIENVRLAIRYYQGYVAPNALVEKILTCGGGANMDKLGNTLARELKIKTSGAMPQLSLKKPRFLILNQNKFLSLTTAIGLAKRAATNDIFNNI